MTLPTWNLTDIVPKYGTTEHDAIVEKLEALVEDFLSHKEKLDTMTASEFKALVEEYDTLRDYMSKLICYATLWQSTDLKDADAKAAVRKYEELGSDISNKLRFFSQWFIKLSKEKAEEFIGVLGPQKYKFQLMYDNGKYVLSEKEENIVSIKDTTGASAFVNLYDMFAASIRVDVNGEEKSLQEIRIIMQSNDRELRKTAHAAVIKEYEKHIDIVGDIYIALVKDNINESKKLRGYDSTLSVRTTREGISEKAVLALMDAAKQSNKIFHEFFKIKAKLMGLEKLEGYDINCPIVLTDEQKFTFDEAFEYILTATKPVSEEYAQFFEHMRDIKHIDAEINQNKRGGAFCEFFGNGIDPYVFQQFQGTYEDMRTLAHELGHALQGNYVKKLTAITHHPSIGIAESTSTFMEEVVFEHELGQADEKRKLELLVQSVFECFATIQLQIYVAISEIQYHDAIEAGAGHEELTQIWTDITDEMFGEGVNRKDKALSWAYRPHIYHSPFYCYNYGIGQILSLIFMKQLRTDENFVEKFTKYMAAGGTMSSVETAKIMGIDLEDPKTWLMGYEIVQERLDELKKLVD